MNIALYSLTEIKRAGLLTLSGNAHIALFIAIAVLLVVGSYFLGSINFAIYISKAAYNKDIRTFGSGNAGSTNVMRTFGTKAALIVLLGDIMKSFISVTVTMLVCGIEIAYLAGLFAMIGHCYPIYYQFKGGKGFATAAGLVLAADPIAFLICATIFVIIVASTKFISAGSMMAAMFLPLVLNMLYRASGGIPGAVAICSVLLAVFIVFRHKENISRIMKGEEKKFSFKKSVPTNKENEGAETEKGAEEPENSSEKDTENK
ncbi:MAG: glycerol-3-phosphate 1-O-acyltransferase PlsY [Clostridia bacterium]|nr:glycerol-3-phosphate 1-O-acyltransferase PlsY [Clostridia bacterium]